MKAFVGQVALFLLLQAALFVALCSLDPRTWGDTYLAAWNDKAARAGGTPSPRILLVGGSGLAFGVDSARLEEALGRPVVNLGLHAALRPEIILRQAEALAREGDVVVLSPEYAFFGPRGPQDGDIKLELLTVAPASLRFFAAADVHDALDGGLILAARRIRGFVGLLWHGRARFSVYRRSAFTPRGDVVAHHGRRPAWRWDLRVYGPAFSDARAGAARRARRPAPARLKVFVERVRARGALPVLSPPPVAARANRDTLPSLDALWSQLRAAFPLEAPRRRVPRFPSRLFFDTQYHLVREGAQRRTALIAADVRAVLQAYRTRQRWPAR